MTILLPPRTYADEIKQRIQAMCDSNPRSQQVEIGASEIGTPCTRKLVYSLGNVTPANPIAGTWRQHVGTLIHAGLADMLARWNREYSPDSTGRDRYLIEHEISIGTFGNDNRILKGHADVFDLHTSDVLDWKTLGATSLKKMKKNNHPGQTNETQAHCYGMGFEKAGIPVNDVHIFSLPQSGELSEMWHWSTPYNPTVARNALERAHNLTLAAEQLGYAALAGLSAAAEDYCETCPWFSPLRPDPAAGRCPGAPEIQAERQHRAHAAPPKPFG